MEETTDLKKKLKELAAYRIGVAPVLKNKVYVCGRCGKRINRMHNFCHVCGQRQLKN